MRPKLFFFITLTILLCSTVSAQGYVDRDRFFSHERFSFDLKYTEEMPSDGRTQQDISSFTSFFIDGIYEFSSGDFEEAERGGEKFLPLLTGQYLNSGIVCYKMRAIKVP